jgi:hypothetical protein
MIWTLEQSFENEWTRSDVAGAERRCARELVHADRR